MAEGTATTAKKVLPNTPDRYELLNEIGYGASAVVWRARCKDTNEEVAIKIMDLEECPTDLATLRKEIQIMLLCSHPNVVQYYCSFVNGKELWVVMELLEGGSCSDIMKFKYKKGLPGPVIEYVLYEVLKALNYFHKTNRIHRDIKGGNILLGGNGEVRLADFGISTWLIEFGARRSGRRTFAGTACWMAPEVIEQQSPYGTKADIWSFGILALELALGQPPNARVDPMKLLHILLTKPPPTISREELEEKGLSKYLKSLIDGCLKRDPAKRPTAEKLLEHKLFTRVRKGEHATVVQDLVKALPPLSDRVKITHPRSAMPSKEGYDAARGGEKVKFNFDVEDDDGEGDQYGEADEGEVDEAASDDDDYEPQGEALPAAPASATPSITVAPPS